MKKVYMLEDLDCANCASKMEAAINRIEGVSGATVSFALQKIFLEAEEQDIQQIERKMVKVCRKIEPDCRIKI